MLIVDTLMLKRRERLAEKFISGEWGVNLSAFETGVAAERGAEAARGKKWRA